MSLRFPLMAAVALVLAGAATPALAQSNGDQRSARAEMQAGRAMPIREIERRIVPQVQQSAQYRGAEYMGFEYIEGAQAYRLRFIRNGRLIFVDVDAQTARVLGVSR